MTYPFQVPHPDTLLRWLERLLNTLLILAFAWLLNRAVGALLTGLRRRFVRVMKMRPQAELTTQVELEKRSKTLSEIIRKITAVVIWVSGGVLALRELGLDVRPIIAGAGVAGLAVGFGAQNLIRDVITGILMLLENQIRINDIAVINGVQGLVEEINLRTTVLRAGDGAVHVFPNGAIQSLANLTMQFSYYVLDIEIAYHEDTDRAVRAVEEASAAMLLEAPYQSAALAPLEMLGVDRIADGAVYLKARVRTLPNQQWTVGRELNRRIKKRFEDGNIATPPRRGDVQAAFDSEAVRRIVREELEKPR